MKRVVGAAETKDTLVTRTIDNAMRWVCERVARARNEALSEKLLRVTFSPLISLAAVKWTKVAIVLALVGSIRRAPTRWLSICIQAYLPKKTGNFVQHYLET